LLFHPLQKIDLVRLLRCNPTSEMGPKCEILYASKCFPLYPRKRTSTRAFPPPGGETLATAIVNAIAAGSQHKTIKSISHRTAVSASVPTMTARYWTGPAAALTRAVSAARAARWVCISISAALASPPLDAKVVARLALLIGQVHRTNRPAAVNYVLTRAGSRTRA
jgi:hypothetical protein